MPQSLDPDLEYGLSLHVHKLNIHRLLLYFNTKVPQTVRKGGTLDMNFKQETTQRNTPIAHLLADLDVFYWRACFSWELAQNCRSAMVAAP